MYEAILFDVDGTLLSVNGEEFSKEYGQRLMEYMEEKLPDVGKEIAYIALKSSQFMLQNDGEKTNEELFWSILATKISYSREVIEPLFLDFYQNQFGKIGHLCKSTPIINDIVQVLVDKKIPILIATNPMFPQIANQHRLQWAGVADAPWIDVTCFEQYGYCKPNEKYFLEICKKNELDPQKCLMIGNGMIEDMAAVKVGMDFYLVLDEVKDGEPTDFQGKKGTRQELLEFVKSL